MNIGFLCVCVLFAFQSIDANSKEPRARTMTCFYSQANNCVRDSTERMAEMETAHNGNTENRLLLSINCFVPILCIQFICDTEKPTINFPQILSFYSWMCIEAKQMDNISSHPPPQKIWMQTIYFSGKPRWYPSHSYGCLVFYMVVMNALSSTHPYTKEKKTPENYIQTKIPPEQ